VGRIGEPRDIAALVGFLLSEAAGFITGQTLVADGGMTRKMIYV
jgi:NAD(P)-dependent dehydrogenase (short-subunit alcohol dehydrogenase family)